MERLTKGLCSRKSLERTDRMEPSNQELENNCPRDEGPGAVNVDDILSSTPREQLVDRLAASIEAWWDKDLSRLVSLSEEDVVKLLETRMTIDRSCEPVIHHIVERSQTSTFLFLLRRVASSHHFHSLIRLKDKYEINVLGCAFMWNRSDIYRYLVSRLDEDEALNLLCEPAKFGKMVLTLSLELNDSLDGALSLLDESQTDRLLFIRDLEGQTVLINSICNRMEKGFQSILKHYTNNPSKLLELAAIPDKTGNTCFHHAAGLERSNFLAALIVSTGVQDCSFFAVRNDAGQTVLAYSLCCGSVESFQFVTRFQSDERSKLYKLAFIPDNNGKTSFHYAANKKTAKFLLNLLEATGCFLSHDFSMITEDLGCTILTRSIHWENEEMFQSLLRLYSKSPSVLFKHASIRDDRGITSFHYAAERKTPNFLNALMNATGMQDYNGASPSDGSGRTVLSYSIYLGMKESFDSIINFHNRKPSKLLELAALRDDQGNTGFHYAAGQETPWFLLNLIRSTWSWETRDQLADVLSLCNSEHQQQRPGVQDKKSYSDNKLTYDWAYDSLKNNRYLIFDFPSILIMYSTVRRPNADKEAKILEECFSALGMEVKTEDSFTKDGLYRAIRKHQESEASLNGQIVALMSHGYEGYIEDSEGVMILLREIEHWMCPASHIGITKLLILQCCQSGNLDESTYSTATGDNSNNEPYDATSDPSSFLDAKGKNEQRPSASFCPRHPDFCVLMSTGAGVISERNMFIPALAEVIRQSDINTSISQVMGLVKAQFPKNGPIQEQVQAPGCQDWLKHDFCIKNILPIYLQIKNEQKLQEQQQQQQQLLQQRNQQQLEQLGQQQHRYQMPQQQMPRQLQLRQLELQIQQLQLQKRLPQQQLQLTLLRQQHQQLLQQPLQHWK